MSISDYRIETYVLAIPADGEYYVTTVSGEDGEVILGGGWEQYNGPQNFPHLQIVSNHPTPDGTRYAWRFKASNPGSVSVDVKVYAIFAIA